MISDIKNINMALAFNKIPGWLTAGEGYSLFFLVANFLPEGEIVEIGSFMGRSTCWLAAGCRRKGQGKVTAIDHFHGSPEHRQGGSAEILEIVSGIGTRPAFENVITSFQLNDYVTIREKDSADIDDWTEKVGLLFIDGDHSYEAVKKDFMSWLPFLVTDGIVCFHDYQNPEFIDGVTKFIDTEIANKFECLFRVDSLVGFKIA